MRKIFLDMDGTLIDSRKRHSILLANIISRYGKSDDDISDYLEYKRLGFSTKKYLINRLGFTEERAVSISNEWIEHIEDENYLKFDCLFDDAIPFLNWLKNKGEFIVFITARKNLELLNKFLFDKQLNVFADKVIVVNPCDAHNGKREQIEDISSGETVIIGDSEIDYFADKKCYMLNRGFRNKEFWDRRGIKSYPSLLEILSAIDRENLLI